MNEATTLTIWTIFKNPLDAPGKFVTRPFMVDETNTITHGVGFVEDNLELARKHVPPGRVKILPSVGDNPSVVESWI